MEEEGGGWVEGSSLPSSVPGAPPQVLRVPCISLQVLLEFLIHCTPLSLCLL